MSQGDSWDFANRTTEELACPDLEKRRFYAVLERAVIP
jgi:hypothetical protein